MAASPPFVELAVTTGFSFLRGASHPEEYVAAAQALGHRGIGIADRNTLAGVVRAHAMAREHGVRLAIGARLVFADGTPDILAYPQDRAAYGRLCRLLTAGNLRAEKGNCILTRADLLAWSEGLCLALLPPRRAADDLAGLLAVVGEAAPGRLWLAAPLGAHGDDARRLARLAALARACRLPLLATTDALYHDPVRRPLQDIVTAIRLGVPVEKAGRRLEANAERHLKSPAEMARLYRAAPEAVAETWAFFSRLTFSLDDLKPAYPREARAGFDSPQAALEALAFAGAAGRYPHGVPEKVRAALAYELDLIGRLDYAPYFLTVHEIVGFARSRDILCQGRGSAANSVVCFCLGLTDVDPMVANLLFERFISEERGEPPDIDIDFEHARRGEVLAFVYERYGAAHAGLAATTITYRTRSAVREVGKAMGLSADTTGALAGAAWRWSANGVSGEEARRLGLDPADPRLAHVLDLTRQLVGFPRHLSQHVGGMVVTHDRLDETVPLTRSGMDERPIIEWNKDDLEAVGLLKVDVLALGMLTAVKNCFALLGAHYDRPMRRIGDVPQEDPRVYAMLQRADSIGVFQVESRAQQTMLPRLRPERFQDLVVEVAIVRPGPIQGGMVHPYLRRRQGLDPVDCPPDLEQVLAPTLGIPLFQEQAMQIAIIGAGFSPGKADRLRRAMATFKRVGTITAFHDDLIAGMMKNGHSRDFAESLWRQIEGFGSYGFPQSHAESFALIVYCSAWLKCRYPDVFLVGLLNAWPMGFYAPAQLVRDACEHGVEVRPVDVNASFWYHTLEREVEEGAVRPAIGRLHPRHRDMAGDIRTTHAVRLGLRQVEGLAEADGARLVAARGGGYGSVRDLWLRSGLTPAVLERLADADAFRSLGLDRRAALWAVKGLRRAGDKDDLPLLRALLPPDPVVVPSRAAPARVETAAPSPGFGRGSSDASAPGRMAQPEAGTEGEAMLAAGAPERTAQPKAGTGRDVPVAEAPERAPAPAPAGCEPQVRLPVLPQRAQVVEDYRRLGLSLKAHPLAFLRRRLAARGIVPAGTLAALPSGRRVRVAGLVLVRQRPGTASGVIFMSLEDESAWANVIVWPRVFERFRPQVLGARLVMVDGRLQNAHGVTHVVAQRLEDLSPLLAGLDDAGEAVPPPPVDSAPGPDSVFAAMPKGRNFH